jgi:hypothetical protein
MSQDLPTYSALTSQNQFNGVFSPYVSKSDIAEVAALRRQGIPMEDAIGLGEEIYDDTEYAAIQQLGGILP